MKIAVKSCKVSPNQKIEVILWFGPDIIYNDPSPSPNEKKPQ